METHDCGEVTVPLRHCDHSLGLASINAGSIDAVKEIGTTPCGKMIISVLGLHGLIVLHLVAVVKLMKCSGIKEEEIEICNDICCSKWNDWSIWSLCSILWLSNVLEPMS